MDWDMSGLILILSLINCIISLKRYVTEVSPNGNEVVKCYKFFKVNEYDEWVLENKK